MPSDRIIKPGDVFEYISTGLRSSFVILVVDPLTFQGAEEALHDGIVVAVACAAHTDLNVIGSQDLADLLAGILAAPIGVVEQSWIWLTLIQRHAQGVFDQIGGNGGSYSIQRSCESTNPSPLPDTTSLLGSGCR